MTLGKKMYGYPLNMTFINAEKVWQEVKNTELHLIKDEHIELALSVKIQEYPHNILSVWVFICVLYEDDHYD
jgi:coiled-coil and C2 domain-containing protein 2A